MNFVRTLCVDASCIYSYSFQQCIDAAHDRSKIFVHTYPLRRMLNEIGKKISRHIRDKGRPNCERQGTAATSRLGFVGRGHNTTRNCRRHASSQRAGANKKRHGCLTLMVFLLVVSTRRAREVLLFLILCYEKNPFRLDGSETNGSTMNEVSEAARQQIKISSGSTREEEDRAYIVPVLH